MNVPKLFKQCLSKILTNTTSASTVLRKIREKTYSDAAVETCDNCLNADLSSSMLEKNRQNIHTPTRNLGQTASEIALDSAVIAAELH